MNENSSKKKPVTDAFIGALQKNDEMNRTGKVKKDGHVATPAANGKNPTFTTDAFKDALKVNEEMNKRDLPQKS